MTRILTIILGETRSHELTWNNFKTNVLEHLNSDLALCVGSKKETDPFFEHAKYIWTYPELGDDWGQAFDSDVFNGNTKWRIMLNLKDQLFGGIKESGHPGSAAILLFFRWFLRTKIIEHNLVDMYDFFIVTRSDYYYELPHPLIEDLESIHLPEGESYGGISDRHMVIPSKYILQALNVTERFLDVHLFQNMYTHQYWNLEKYLALHFVIEGLFDKLKYFPRVMYAVRSETANTRWAQGYFEPEVNMVVKYQSEYELAKKNKYISLELIHPHMIIDSRNSCSKYQIPDLAMPLMNYENHEWSFELVDTLVNAAVKREDFSPRDYPFCVVDFYKAFDEFPVYGKTAMVAGSISPWNEAILLAYGASKVHTVDYSKISVDYPLISTFLVGENMCYTYDVVCSFSSVEHDGLGRYGDPIDSMGDFKAMKEFNSKLNQDGLLFLGIPVGERGVIEGNCHRIYNKQRFDAMIEYSGFKLEKIIDDHWSWSHSGINWQNQPIFVLRKIRS